MSRRILAAFTAALTLAAGALVATAPSAAADVYTEPGYHVVNGREWRTTCEPYSQTKRCRTEIKASTVIRTGARYVQTTGWVFNNLTYLPSDARLWAGNPLARTGQWTASDGRLWRTECNTPATGRNGCRSYSMVDVVAAVRSTRGTSFVKQRQWVLNNIVQFTTPTSAVAPTPKPTPTPAPTPTLVGPYDARVGIDDQDTFAKSLVEWTNKARIEDGVKVGYGNDGKAVAYDPTLNAEALKCAQSNLAHGSLDHSLPGCVAGDGLYTENLAGTTIGRPVSVLVDGWMKSPGHYSLMTSALNVGFGGAYACDAEWCVAVIKAEHDWSLYPGN